MIITQSLTSLITSYGLVAVFVLMTAESALIPIPSEITMPFAGFLAASGLMGFWPAVAMGALGNLVGSLIAYGLGYWRGEKWTLLIIKKWGKWILIKEHEYRRAKKWFSKYGQTFVFVSRLLPVIRTYSSLPAGIARVNVVVFSVLTFVGSFIWAALLAWLGFTLRDNWRAIEPYFRQIQVLIVVLVVVAIGVYIWKKTRK